VRVLQLVTLLVEVMGSQIAPYLATLSAALPALWQAASAASGGRAGPGAADAAAAVRLHGALISVLSHLIARLRGTALGNAGVASVVYPLLAYRWAGAAGAGGGGGWGECEMGCRVLLGWPGAMPLGRGAALGGCIRGWGGGGDGCSPPPGRGLHQDGLCCGTAAARWARGALRAGLGRRACARYQPPFGSSHYVACCRLRADPPAPPPPTHPPIPPHPTPPAAPTSLTPSRRRCWTRGSSSGRWRWPARPACLSLW
jgi:hypothetical protein